MSQDIRNIWVKTSLGLRPKDGETIVYWFEPFDKPYFGVYDAETDSVSGPCGFTSFEPEVTKFWPVPDDLGKFKITS